MTSSRRPALASRAAACVLATALAIATTTALSPASAGELILGLGQGNASTRTAPTRETSVQGVVGYRFLDRQYGVQLVGFGATDTYHRPPVAGGAPLYDFDRALALQGVAYLKCTPQWDLYGAAGVARVRSTSATPGAGTQEATDLALSVGVHWQVVGPLGLTVDIARLNKAGVTSPTVRGELVF